MLRNYLLTALRSFAKKKNYTFINILGLAIGLASSFLIFLWVQSEYQIDRFHANGQRLYQVLRNVHYASGPTLTYQTTPKPLAQALEDEFPEIKAAELISWEEESLLAYDENSYREQGNYVGEDFFEIFSYPLTEGDPATVLNEMNAIVISETMAQKYFGDQSAVGKILRFEDREDLRVSGVFRDIPKQSSIDFDFVRPMKRFIRDNSWVEDWGSNGLRLFVLVAAQTDITQLNSKIKDIVDERQTYDDADVFLKPYADRHLYSKYENGHLIGGRITYVRIFSVVAVFMLIIACINFMNLATARSGQRAKEVGVRKAIGANKNSLIGQFMTESTLVVLFALSLAVLLVELSLPFFNQLTDKSITINYLDPTILSMAAGIILFTGLLAGSYPALFLSSFQPARVLKGTVQKSQGAALFRKGLVVFQFAVSILLVIGTIIVYEQVNYILNKDLGLEKENVIYTYREGALLDQYETYKQQLMQQPGISAVTSSSQSPLSVGRSTGNVEWEGKQQDDDMEFMIVNAEYDFVSTMGMRLKDGRYFSPDFSTDTTNYVINEAAARAMGLVNPVGEGLTVWDESGKIIGIVEDFHAASLHEQIDPLIMRLTPDDTYLIFVRTETGKTAEALASMKKVAEAINPAYPFEYKFLDQTFQEAYQREETIGKLSTIFATLAILISCLGLLGLASFTAEQRTKEIGVRKVLGASITHLVWLLSSDFTRLVTISFVIASPIAYYLMRQWLQDFEYQVELSVGIFALAGIAALLIAWLTVGYQSIRTARANPVDSLRSE
ncbi:ABC transporter permease [Tunicatimonas pelagia]|uniref:ABC transporter permease n=1 Tax=Tunicatimonas pelagia TaxID=931531 RepID=UPI0026663FDD|nr:ABC transporter permease [Tunicatimonas pelagia]WKN41058.1 ABC transporter permease [Tunicatimonas pelagia]